MQATPEAIWEVLADPTTYPDWLVGAQVIRQVDDEFPAPGADFHHTVGVSDDAALPDKTTAVDADPPHRLQLKVRARPFFQGMVTFRLEPKGDGTEVTVHEEPIGWLRLAGPVLDPILSARNKQSLAKLSELVESGSPAR